MKFFLVGFLLLVLALPASAQDAYADGSKDHELVFDMRYQQAFGRHTILVLDGFASDSGLTGSGN